METSTTPLYQRRYAAETLVALHPPKLRHPHKKLVEALACPAGSLHAGTIVATRWREFPLPKAGPSTRVAAELVPGFYDYAGTDAGVWHVNFADPQLFIAYGSGLLAQDELQCCEHPALGSLREALLAESLPALTEENGRPTPVTISGVERRCVIALDPNLDEDRPYGLYGNRFKQATPAAVAKAVRRLEPPTRTNFIAIAAPSGGTGPYWRSQIDTILVTAYTGFKAAALESQALWTGARVEIRTGFWGCGAFGGNRRAMTVLQLLAASLAGVSGVRFYAGDGEADFRAGARDFAAVAGAPGEPLGAILERIEDLDYEWGVSDGN